MSAEPQVIDLTVSLRGGSPKLGAQRRIRVRKSGSESKTFSLIGMAPGQPTSVSVVADGGYAIVECRENGWHLVAQGIDREDRRHWYVKTRTL